MRTKSDKEYTFLLSNSYTFVMSSGISPSFSKMPIEFSEPAGSQFIITDPSSLAYSKCGEGIDAEFMSQLTR